MSTTAIDRFGQDLHDGQDLKEIVLGEVLVRVVFVQLLAEESAHRNVKLPFHRVSYRPEVVHYQIEDA